MEPINEGQIAQGIAPGNNWYVAWVLFLRLLAKQVLVQGTSRSMATNFTQKAQISSHQMLSGLA